MYLIVYINFEVIKEVKMASRYLKDVRYDRALRLKKGKFVHNYRDLAEELTYLDDSDFKAVGPARITSWIRDNYGDRRLITQLKGVRSRTEIASVVSRKVSELKHDNPDDTNVKPALFFLLIVALVALVFIQHLYYDDKYQDLSEQVISLLDEVEVRNVRIQTHQDRVGLLETEINRLDHENLLLREESTRLNMSQKVPCVAISCEKSADGPQDRIPENKIALTKQSVVFSVNNPILAKFTDTGSMLPVITAGSHAIEIVPRTPEELAVGDIVSYELDGKTLVHRIIETGQDSQGWYAKAKGDNLDNPDPGKVRFSQVRRVVVAIIY